jgi:uncharacterized protein YggE
MESPAASRKAPSGTLLGVLVCFFCTATSMPLSAQPTEGITAEGFHRLETPADLALVSLTVSSAAESPTLAEARLNDRTAKALAALRANGIPTESLQTADRPLSIESGGQAWRAVRDLHASVPRGAIPALLDSLRALPFVASLTLAPYSSELAAAQTRAISEATADARRKAEAAARELGFALGTPREIRVLDANDRRKPVEQSSALISIEARVAVRYALVPATTQTEILAIAAAKENQRGAATTPPSSTTIAAASNSASATVASVPAIASSSAVTVEIVAAIYDSTGRGRFTTAAGTLWREVVPTPLQQRLKNGRTYRGTITAGVFGGYRMEVEGIPRILKVEPVKAKKP